jgi:hypothetical protein
MVVKMSCDRRCFDKDDLHFGFDDCANCPGADHGTPEAYKMDYEKLKKISPHLSVLQGLDTELIKNIAADAGFFRGSGVNSTWTGAANGDDHTHDALYRFAAMIISMGKLKLYCWYPDSPGPSSFFVVAKSQKEAEDLVYNYIVENEKHTVGEWPGDFYLEIADIGEIKTNCNS